MSLLGYDNNDKTLSGDVEIYATNVYATNIYDGAVNVGDTLITLQAEIDALEAQIISSGTTGYYGIYGSTNNATNPLAEKNFYFSQNIAQNGFTITGGTGLSATRITATYAGVYNIYYKANYQKVDTTTAYEVRTWLMKNGVDLDYSTTLHTFSTTSQWQQISGQFIVSLSANDYLQIAWLSTNASASSDILDFISSTSPYPQVSSMFACIQQVANTDTGLDAVFEVASTNTLPAGSSASVVDTTTTFPTYINHSLVFGIPKGDKGDAGTNGTNGTNGATGPQGPKGDKGNTGDQGPQGPAGDGPIAVSALALASATSVALTAYTISNNAEQAVQNATLATHTADIATDEARITALEVITDDMSWGTFTGTTFSRQVHITNIDPITTPGSDAVYLNASGASTFLYGLSASNAISTTSTITSTAGTSQMSSLLVNNNMEITNDTFITAGELYLTRTLLNNQKKLVLYDNATGNDYDYLGFWTMDGATGRKFFNTEIDGNANSAFQWYYGNDLGSARTLMKYMNQTQEISYIPTSKFLKSAGATQEISLVRDSANSRVRIDMIGDTNGLNDYDGQIIQEQGNGVDDNTGTMTIQSGGLQINALNAGLNFQATTSTLIQSTTTTTLTSGTGTEINCTTFDLNATGETNISVDDAINISATSIAGTITISTATSDIVLNSANSIDTTSIDVSIITSTGGADLTLSNPTSDAFELNCPNGELIISSVGTTTMNTNILDINSTNQITMDGTSMTITTTGETEINSTIFDLNASSTINMDGTSMTLNATTGNMTWTTSTTGDFNITSGRNINFITNETGGIMNCTSNKDQDIFRVYNSDNFDTKFLIGSSTQGFRTSVNNNSYANLNGLGQTQVNLSTNNAQINLTAGGANGKLTLTSSLSEVEINSVALDMNATGAITMDTTTTFALTASTNTILGTTNVNTSGTLATSIGNTTGTLALTGSTNTILGTTNVNTSGTLATSIGNTTGTLALTGSTNTILGTTNVNTSGTLATSIGNTTGTLALTGSTNTILGTTNVNTSGTLATSIGNTTGTLALTGSTNTILGTTNINRTGSLATNIGNTGAVDVKGSTMNVATTGNQSYITTSGDIQITGTDVFISTTGTTLGEFVVRANTNVDIKANTGNLELNANTTMLIKSDGTNTLQIGAEDKMTTSSDTTTITNNNVIIEPASLFNMMPTATIIQNLSSSVPSGFLYCDGGAISRTTYARLFTAIGTAFGTGDGITTFNKPNFQGAFLRGAGTQTISGTAHTASAIGTAQADDVLKHIHTYSDLYWSDDLMPNRTIALTGGDYEVPGGDNNGVNTDGSYSKRMTSSKVFAEGATQTNAYTDPGSEIGAETRPMNYAVYYYIRY